LELEPGVRAHLDAADEIIARRHEHLATTRRAGIERFLEGGGIFGGAVANGAEIADVENGLVCHAPGFASDESQCEN
jgi:hypothetical protein